MKKEYTLPDIDLIKLNNSNILLESKGCETYDDAGHEGDHFDEHDHNI